MNRANERSRTGLYRSRRGVILGVCRGVADYFDISVFWTRVVFVAVLLFTGIWPIAGLYLVAAALMKPEPVVPFRTEVDREFYNSYTASRELGLHRLKGAFDRLDRRLRRMEDLVTAREFDWDRRFRGPDSGRGR
ncbi:MAG: envelope stress response membrane protein PspC [Deltaproteobacteria bacterium]|nr:envelope stress response membrane protein PspC [Deltaproteobacteria bacterium]